MPALSWQFGVLKFMRDFLLSNTKASFEWKEFWQGFFSFDFSRSLKERAGHGRNLEIQRRDLNLIYDFQPKVHYTFPHKFEWKIFHMLASSAWLFVEQIEPNLEDENLLAVDIVIIYFPADFESSRHISARPNFN